MRTRATTVGLLIALAGCGSSEFPATEPTETTVEKETSTTTEQETTTTEEATTTTRARTTTTEVDVLADPELARIALTSVMCDEYGGPDPAFGLDWCSIGSESSELASMIETTCSTLDSLDPTRSLSDDEIGSRLASLTMEAVASGDITMEEAGVTNGFAGAVYGAREGLCP